MPDEAPVISAVLLIRHRPPGLCSLWHGTTQGMAFEAIEHRTFSARMDCHYLVHSPAEVNAYTLLVATLHGFGSNPEMMLRLTESLLGTRNVITALQAPSQFYLAPHANEVGYCWATHK